MQITTVALRVADQESARRFYTEVLGFTVTEDVQLEFMRWLTVSPPGQPELNVLLEKLRPLMVDEESAAHLDALLAKGFGGTLFFKVDDCRAEFDRLVAAGVEVVQEPQETFYGIDAAFRDSGNQMRMVQNADTGVPWPDGRDAS